MWQDLLKSALLGTENSSLPEQALEALGIDTSREAPLVLADGIALHSQMRKAAFPLAEFSGEGIAPVQDFHRGSQEVARLLETLLERKYTGVLPEFMQLLETHNLPLPTAQLPELLALIPAQTFIPQNKKALGADARWLIAQHPEWQKHLLDTADFDWQTGSKVERLALLQHLRETRPGEARALLESTWHQESAPNQLMFLAALEAGLSLTDEPFLERLLDEKKKEIRKEAAKNLAKIPGSALAKRMKKRALACFEKKKNDWKINLPEEPDEAAQRDGIQKLMPRWQGGTKAAYLGQLLAKTQPSVWEELFEKSPEEVLRFFSKTDWSEPLLEGAYEAALFHENQAWTEACLAFQLQLPANSRSDVAFSLQSMSHRLSAPVFNRIALQFFEENSGLPDVNSFGRFLLKTAQTPWSDELALLIINRFHEAVRQSEQADWRHIHWKDYLQLAGLYASPSLLEQLQQLRSEDAPAWRMWERHYEEMLEILLFRRGMRVAFGSSPGG